MLQLLKSLFLVILFVSFASGAAFARAESEHFQQQKIITGTVTDENGNPLKDATVQVKGSSASTTTDDGGKFTIQVPGTSSVLIISYVGYASQEISVRNAGNNLTIRLKLSSGSLGEVVVVAYGTAKKEAFTGSATFVKGEQLQRSVTNNVAAGLQGLSPGVQINNTAGRPGADVLISIRGFGSMTASNNPLIILNGNPYDGSLNSIPTSDIEQVSILKDAASTALYGSRAANGVIIITTKQGKKGAPRVNYRSTFSVSDFAVALPKRLSVADQWMAVWKGFYDDGILFQGRTPANAAQNATVSTTNRHVGPNPFTMPDGTVRQYRHMWNMDFPIGLDGKLDPNAKLLYEWDWYDVFTNKLRQEHSVDVSSGIGEKGNLFFSSSYLNDQGNYLGQKYERFTSRLNFSVPVNDRIKTGASFFYVRTNENNPNEEVRTIRTFAGGFSPYLWDHVNNTYFTDIFGNKALDWGGAGSISRRVYFPGNNALGWIQDPKSPDSYRFNLSGNNRLIATGNLEIKILKDLDYSLSLIGDLNNNNNHYYESPVNGLSFDLGTASRSFTQRFGYTINNSLSYRKKINDHSLSFLVSNEVYAWRNQSASASAQGFALPGVFEVSAGSTNFQNSSFEDNYRLVSLLGRGEYNFANKYFLSASFRRDGSSRFSPDVRWGNFWSAGGAWRISQEKWFQAEWVNELKLKGSYGETGNDNIGLYAYQALYNLNNIFNGQPGAVISRLPTPTLSWEKNQQANVGIEAILFDKLNVGVEVFSRRSKDLLFAQQLPPSFGITSVDANIATTRNTGIEIDLNYRAVNVRDFTWTIGINATHYKNVIVDLPLNELTVPAEFTNTAGPARRWKEGRSIYEYWGPKWAGVDDRNGNNQWIIKTFDANGNVTKFDTTSNWTAVSNDVRQYEYLGSSLPKLFGSITNSFTYRNFDLSFMLYYSIGGVLFDQPWRESTTLRNAFGLTEMYKEGVWTPENPTASIPRGSHVRFGDNQRPTDQFLFNNTFARLKNLNIGYKLPVQKIFKKPFFNEFKVFVQGDNLLTWGSAKERHTDPELGGFDGTAAYNYGVRRFYLAGVNIQF